MKKTEKGAKNLVIRQASAQQNRTNRRDNPPITCLPGLHNSPEAGA